jgi:hypothetical protein
MRMNRNSFRLLKKLQMRGVERVRNEAYRGVTPRSVRDSLLPLDASTASRSGAALSVTLLAAVTNAETTKQM